jgi:hypothetical protein
LFEEKKKFKYAVFEQTFQTDQGMISKNFEMTTKQTTGGMTMGIRQQTQQERQTKG